MIDRSWVARVSFIAATALAVGVTYVGCGGGGTSSESGGNPEAGGGGDDGGGSDAGAVDATTGPYCGDGVVLGNEQCDFGSGQNLPGSGCEPTCTFSCTTNPDSCSNTDPCSGTAACTQVKGPNGATGQKCERGAPEEAGTSCGDGQVCKGGACTSPGCGNGTVDPGEECDDGNNLDLDGCDSKCNYEVVVRMTSIAIQGSAAPSFCSPATNRLGAQSLTSTAISSLNKSLAGSIDAGTDNVETQFLGLSDLTGASSTTPLTVGLLNGTTDPAKGTWPNQSQIDWWFLAAATTVSNGLPASTFAATLSARQLTAGPSDIGITLVLGGTPAVLEMRDAHIAATLDGTPAPDVPAPPPAKLATGLTVFQQMTGSGANQGLCGNITVESLAQIPIPMELGQGGGATACTAACSNSKAYTYCGQGNPVGPSCNSLLDALVGGCKAVLCVGVITPQQPDVPAGSSVTSLSLGAGNKVPASQTTGDKDAYSSYLTFAGNRAHFTGQSCTQSTDCQTGQTCQGSVCK
ncbi:MAG: DUF4215 domain-containing protein [Polyangiaceae bacterium]